MSRECPRCMPKHRADLAQPEEWRDEHGVHCEGWLHPSGQFPDYLHCNCCGEYFDRMRDGSLRHIVDLSELTPG